ncbi:hypothetical protein STENM327S_03962 [Streptomyces tendae]
MVAAAFFRSSQVFGGLDAGLLEEFLVVDEGEGVGDQRDAVGLALVLGLLDQAGLELVLLGEGLGAVPMGDATVRTRERLEDGVPHPVTEPTGKSLLSGSAPRSRPRLCVRDPADRAQLLDVLPRPQRGAGTADGGLRNADWIWRVEQQLGIAVEESVNHAVNSVTGWSSA